MQGTPLPGSVGSRALHKLYLWSQVGESSLHVGSSLYVEGALSFTLFPCHLSQLRALLNHR